MTAYAKCRDYERGESFPYKNFMYLDDDMCLFHLCDETLYECWMPHEIEDDEFNLVILLQGFPVKARGIHFDFEEK